MKTTSIMRMSSYQLCCVLKLWFSDSLQWLSSLPCPPPHSSLSVSLAFDCLKSVDEAGPDTEHYQRSSSLTSVPNNCFLDTSAERGISHFCSSHQELKKYFLQFGILLITIYIAIDLIILVCFFTYAIFYYLSWFHFTFLKNISRKSTYPGYIEPLSGTRWNKKATELFA